MTTAVRVLVVDDDITLRTLLVFQLDKLGLCADSAASGLEAIRRMQSQQYSLIIMDIQMPGMTGYEAATAMRSYEDQHGRQPIPIIGLSAGHGDSTAAIEHGMSEYVQKPIDLQSLEKLIKKWLG